MQGKARQADENIRSLWDRSMAGALGESRSDETCKKQSIGKYSSTIEEHLDMFHCEFGAWMPDYERGKNSLLNLA